ncbi:MAG: DUF4911 domain-containing protein [bacterium]|nr:DUF4911 domain-containing protein [bacterium]
MTPSSFGEQGVECLWKLRWFVIARERIGDLRCILEAYDGLAMLRTLDPHQALVEVGYPALRTRDAEELLKALEYEIGLVETGCPPHRPEL